jgi:hypothetical protein
METRFLLPNRLKLVGWIFLIPSAFIGILSIFFDFEFKFLDMNMPAIFPDKVSQIVDPAVLFGFIRTNTTGTLAGILVIIGGLLVAFTKEKVEDEFISKIRLESILWATYLNYLILIFCLLFFYDSGFVKVMTLNLYSIIVLFIIRFNFVLYRATKALKYEKLS